VDLRRLRQTMRLAHWSVCPSQVAPMTRGSVDLDDSVHRVCVSAIWRMSPELIVRLKLNCVDKANKIIVLHMAASSEGTRRVRVRVKASVRRWSPRWRSSGSVYCHHHRTVALVDKRADRQRDIQYFMTS